MRNILSQASSVYGRFHRSDVDQMLVSMTEARHDFISVKNTLARLRFILHLKMQACNVLYQPHIYVYFLVSLSLTAPNSLKTRIKLYKIAPKMAKNCLRGGGGGKVGEDVRIGGNSAMVIPLHIVLHIQLRISHTQ